MTRPECKGCGSAFEHCGPLLWAQQKKCCPDCSHDKELAERMMATLFVAPQGQKAGIALTLDRMMLRIGVGEFGGEVMEIGAVPLTMLSQWLRGELPAGVAKPWEEFETWEEFEG